MHSSFLDSSSNQEDSDSIYHTSIPVNSFAEQSASSGACHFPASTTISPYNYLLETPEPGIITVPSHHHQHTSLPTRQHQYNIASSMNQHQYHIASAMDQHQYHLASSAIDHHTYHQHQYQQIQDMASVFDHHYQPHLNNPTSQAATADLTLTAADDRLFSFLDEGINEAELHAPLSNDALEALYQSLAPPASLDHPSHSTNFAISNPFSLAGRSNAAPVPGQNLTALPITSNEVFSVQPSPSSQSSSTQSPLLSRNEFLLYSTSAPLPSAQSSPSSSTVSKIPSVDADAYLRRSSSPSNSSTGSISSKIYQCDLCDKTFHRAYNLKSHRLSHSKVRPYVCQFEGCPWRFSRPHDLRRHERNLHAGHRPYGCPTCGKRFARSDALQRHARGDAICLRIANMLAHAASLTPTSNADIQDQQHSPSTSTSTSVSTSATTITDRRNEDTMTNATGYNAFFVSSQGSSSPSSSSSIRKKF